jgi:hypothetical protein
VSRVIVLCRRADQPPLPGSRTGYGCRSCGVELAVSREGRICIAGGGDPYCNDCGQRVAEAHKEGFDVILTEQAKGQISKLILENLK